MHMPCAVHAAIWVHLVGLGWFWAFLTCRRALKRAPMLNQHRILPYSHLFSYRRYKLGGVNTLQRRMNVTYAAIERVLVLVYMSEMPRTIPNRPDGPKWWHGQHMACAWIWLVGSRSPSMRQSQAHRPKFRHAAPHFLDGICCSHRLPQGSVPKLAPEPPVSPPPPSRRGYAATPHAQGSRGRWNGAASVPQTS